MPSDLDKIPYFTINKFIWKWKLHEGADGCKVVPNIALSMDKPAPLLPIQQKPKVAEPKHASTEPKRDSLDKMVDDLERVGKALARFQVWLNAPGAPKPAIVKLKRDDSVPAFDIQEIPAAMRKIYLPTSAALMERWFSGKLNYSRTSSDEEAEINQDGLSYPSDMYDMSTIKLDWVLRFPRAKQQFDHLINEAIRSQKSINELYKLLLPYKDCATRLYTDDICRNDLRSMHRRFQFQYARIDSTFGQKIGTQLDAQLRNNGVPDDLSGALGSFNIYAALGSARFSWDVDSRRTTAEVTGLWVYVKDNYTFTDKPGERSQYLGHWSSDGVIVVPYSAAAAFLNSEHFPYVKYAVARGNPFIKGNVYYPVENIDFRRWSEMHGRGGDFIIYSDKRYIPISPFIKIRL
ncbi:DUF6402 family protein [Burkholderia cenocepacia]|uniref:DUF6402 family protein n=2 Tax=Burkholderia cenocepacia TaxID=95486 RepID=UPI00163CFB15|nr:DUF6402 family protein [Burkholderia cenocepacia]ELK7725251.1 hypothetical protein [Burkholderia cenocepacia]MDR8028472.1 hypothetical protein [Burkholderia cenocepacia]MDR8045709.1 hypothetical protein [Burkholderia cenocepacia]MEC4775125.1 DUF6402 family protein [Burkholderia cenocepacia]QND93138.1 hypothetical protein SY91_00490 [Burkholderia cenocepacia]